MAEEYLDSPQWAVKHTAARAIADATVAIATMNNDMDATNAAVLWPALERALGGKTWDGKEVVLYAFTKFVETSGTLWSTQPDIAQAIEKVRYDYWRNFSHTACACGVAFTVNTTCVIRHCFHASKQLLYFTKQILTADVAA